MTEPGRKQIRMFDTSLRMDAPGPRGVPIVNNLKFMARSYRYVMQTMSPFHEQPVIPATGGNGSLVLAVGEDAVKQVFNDNGTFHRAGDGVFNVPPGHPWSQMFVGVITANEGEHRRRRRLLMPVVHKTAMDHYREIFAETFDRSRFAAPDDARPFDIVTEFLAVTKTNMLRGLLGVADTPENRQLAADVLALSAAIANPGVVLFQWNKPFTPYGRWVRRVASAYERLAALIEERRAQESRPDALSIICNTTDEDGDFLSTEEIAGELHGLFSAGFETTAMTMTWALLMMLAAGADRDYADDQVLDATLREAQRLLPTVPLSLPRRVVADTSIAGSAPVPAGALLFVSAAIEHHNPAVYAEPFAFRPERWRDTDARSTAFFPFGIGARRCLGAAFAELQARVTLGRLAAQARPLRLLTTHVDYRMNNAVVAGPRKPVMVAFDPAPPPPPALTGTIRVLWHQ